MKKVFVILAILQTICSHAQKIQVIPMPNNVQYGTEVLNTTGILWVFDKNFNAAQQSILNQTKHATQRIDIQYTEQKNWGEKYVLQINKSSIKISGSAISCGYALQTLQQIIDHQATVTTCTITDSPTFAYRGMHLDVCRHFFTVNEVKKYIDLLARYKMNTFHWHLTDDQGWRIEIKKYPLLTSIGGTRKNTLIGRQTDEIGNGKYDNKIVQGFYTQEQIKEVVKYAQSKNINIIPEIEMPGHSLAAIASYPFLGCTELAKKVGNRWGVYEDVYCAGNESVYVFLQSVLDEVIQLFPSKYIHIGGDEVVKTNWQKCTACQKQMQENNLKSTAELQSYFIQRIDKYLTQKGKTPIGWDEILEGGLSANATVMSWRGEEGGIAAANQNHYAIMTPGGYCYFDHSQNKLQNEPLNIGGNTSYQKVYSYNPIPEKLSSNQQQYILGAQGNVWTEYIADWDKLCYMAMPRMQALSEALWTASNNKNLDNFQKNLGVECEYLNTKKINYRTPEPIGFADSISKKK